MTNQTTDQSDQSEPKSLALVRKGLNKTALDNGRTPSDITLIAVTKTYAAAAIRPVLNAGQRIFGENRVQEAQQKWPTLKAEFPDIELHLIGPLQSNKVKQAVELFDAIHTIDRPKIARAIAQELAKKNYKRRLFIQLNTGEEPQKAGILPKDLSEFHKLCTHELNLDITGLMCIPPLDDEPAIHFAFLAERARELGLSDLSMGMSSDFEAAIQMGATHIRVGTAIFGTR